MKKEIAATLVATLARPDFLTTEKLEAVLGGWGQFNVGVWAAANVIGKEIMKGKSLKMTVENVPVLDIDDVAKKAVDVLMRCGADSSNASLVTATLLYWAGASLQVGIPVPNRKLGAVCRLAAGAPAGRVSNIPTEKTNNKISGFAAVSAIYKALDGGIVAPYDGINLPLGVAGSPFLGHSALGEDILFPELIQKFTTIGTKAMIQAYRSAGMKPSKWLSAIFGVAAALEIVHPDAWVADKFGPFIKTRIPYVGGLAAVKAADLPKTIHMRGTLEEFETAKVIGDLGLIIKDVGLPTVVGMIMFNEINACIKEGPIIGVGRAGGPISLPVVHWCSEPAIVLNVLGKGGNINDAAEAIRKAKKDHFQEEYACCSTNVIAKKTEQVNRGPVTNACIMATESVVVNAILRRAEKAYKDLKKGKSIKSVVKALDLEKIDYISKRSAKMVSNVLGKNIEYIKYKKLTPGARRDHHWVKKFLAFDAYADVEIKVDGKVHHIKGLYHKYTPDAILKNDKKKLELISCVAPGAVDLLNAGQICINVTVPACMAAALKIKSPEDAVKEATDAAIISAGIPVSIVEAAELSKRIVEELTLKPLPI